MNTHSTPNTMLRNPPIPTPRALRAILAVAVTLILWSMSSARAQTNAVPPPPAVKAAEAAYTQTIEKRVADILALLELKDPAKTARVHDLLVAQYRALRDWHDANDAKLKKAAEEQAREISASMKTLHARFISGLEAELTPAQVERVKDQMTYGKVKVTYEAYCEIVPNLTEAQKARILELLKEAREEAMDAGSADAKSAVFKRYKGKINNYLSAEGHDVKQAYKDWGEKQKTRATPPAQKTPK
jgi:hypothetical protein